MNNGVEDWSFNQFMEFNNHILSVMASQGMIIPNTEENIKQDCAIRTKCLAFQITELSSKHGSTMR